MFCGDSNFYCVRRAAHEHVSPGRRKNKRVLWKNSISFGDIQRATKRGLFYYWRRRGGGGRIPAPLIKIKFPVSDSQRRQRKGEILGHVIPLLNE
jgi:hypothetical protein